MKVRTHVKAGEFATVAAASNGHVAPGTLPNVIGGLGTDLGGIEQARDFLRREVKPWFAATYYPTQDEATLKQRLGTSSSFTALDERVQAFVQRWIDPLLGDTRGQHLQALSTTGEAPKISQAERWVNRHLATGLTTLGLAVVGTVAFPPLLPLASLTALYGLVALYREAYVGLAQDHKVNTFVPLVISLTGSWFAGLYVLLGIGQTMVYIGRKVLIRTQQHSHQNLVSVFGQQPRSTWVVVGGQELEVPFETVQVGDTVVVHAGQVIPVDGTIIQGAASIDQHLLTGEAQPIERGIGDSVLAATLVLTGAIHIRVEKAGHAIAAAQVADILNHTAAYQMSIESKALAIADRAALPTLAVGALAWPIAGLEGAVAILAVNVGAQMRLLGPIAMLNYLNILSRNGILVKDGRSLELLNDVDTIVFDKTGTLTLEQPLVAQVHVCDGFSEDELLVLAATAEQRQAHPIAYAVLTAARGRGLEPRPLDNAHYEVGFGVKVWVGEQLVRVGSPRFMELEGIATPPSMGRLQQECAQQGNSLVMVAVNEQLGGALELQAAVRPEVEQVIRRLRERKLSLYILSGDQEAPTRRLAHELGMDHYVANVLPQGKAEVIERLQQEGKSVCFVGDGINDGIALKKAHVSVSLRGATTVATDAAQIVLMDQSLHQLGYLLDISDEFKTTFQRSLASGVVPDAILVGGVFLAHFGLAASLVCFTVGMAAGVASAMWPIIKRGGTDETTMTLPAPAAPPPQLAG